MGNLAKRAAGSRIEAAKPQDGIAALLDKGWDRIAQVMPKHMDPERLYQLSLSAINQTPKLAECSPATLLSCVMKCSALGLEPSAVDGLGRAYILPFKNWKTKGMEATFILGYKGMLDLARRSGQIKDISARAVYDGDDFSYEFGLHEDLRHTPSTAPKEGRDLTHVYMVAHFTDGGHYFDVMTREECEAIRKRSKAKDSGPWVTDYEAMCKKSVIRRAFPYLPVSIEAKEAVAADETSGGFEQAIRFDPIVGSEEAIQAHPQGQTTEEEAQELAGAVCLNCGNIVQVAPDASMDDLSSVGCCDTPRYQLIEA